MQANINDGLGRTVLDAQTGAGDIVIGPMFQFDPIMGANGPRFVQRFEFDFIVPTGKYNPKYAVNPGSNFWSFNPYWSATLWFTKQWSSSIRLYYLWKRAFFGRDFNICYKDKKHKNFDCMLGFI